MDEFKVLVKVKPLMKHMACQCNLKYARPESKIVNYFFKLESKNKGFVYFLYVYPSL